MYRVMVATILVGDPRTAAAKLFGGAVRFVDAPRMAAPVAAK